MSDRLTKSYEIYRALKGKFVKVASKSKPGRRVIRPTNKKLWSLSRSICDCDDRICAKCRATTVVASIGEMPKCCGMIMDVPQQKPSPKPSLKTSTQQPKKEKIEAVLIEDVEDYQDSHWVVKTNNIPVYKISLKQAYRDSEHPSSYKKFSDEAYGRSLTAAIQKHGVEHVAENVLRKRGTLFVGGQANAAPVDFMAKEPQVQDTEGDIPERPRGEQAGKALVDRDVGEELLEEKPDKAEILNLIQDALVPILQAAGDEISVEDVVRELQMLSANEAALAEFKGELDEKVNSAEDETEEDVEEDVEEQQQANVAGPEQVQTPPPTQQPMATASVVLELRRQMVTLAEDLKNAKAHSTNFQDELQRATKACKGLVTLNKKLEADGAKLKGDNKVLLKEREARMIMPRVKRLAQKMAKVGLTPEDQLDQVQVDLFQLPDEEFLRKEREVEGVLIKMESNKEARTNPLDTRGVLAGLPAQVDEDNSLGMNGQRMNSAKKGTLSDFWTGAPRP